MYKEKSCTVVHYFASTFSKNLWKRKKKIDLRSSKIIFCISSAGIDIGEDPLHLEQTTKKVFSSPTLKTAKPTPPLDPNRVR